MNKPSRLVTHFCLIALVLAAGCAEQAPRLYPASGTIYYNNRPIPNAELVFHPQFAGPGWMPVARVDEHGDFEASTKLPGDGALPGRYIITVVWHPESDNQDGTNLLPARYADPKTSGLEITIGPDSSDLPLLKLTDDHS